MREKPNLLDVIKLPPLTTDNVQDAGLERLAEAIVIRAVQDYADAIHTLEEPERHRRLEREKAEYFREGIPRFFHSGWFHDLANDRIDGDKIIWLLENDMPFKWMSREQQKEILKRRKQEEKERKENGKAKKDSGGT